MRAAVDNLELNIVFGGDFKTGKTGLITRLIEDTFSPEHRGRIGVNKRTLNHEESGYSLNICETVGRENFQAVNQEVYALADTIVLVFDVTSMRTFNNLSRHLETIKAVTHPSTQLLLIGNKSDLGNRTVSEEEAEVWALQNDMFYLDFTAKNASKMTLISKLTEVILKNFV